MSDLDRAREIVDNPRGLPIEQWREAARLLDEHRRQRRLAVGGTYRDPDPDDGDDFTVDDAAIRPTDVSGAYGCAGGAYYVERNSGPGWAQENQPAVR